MRNAWKNGRTLAPPHSDQEDHRIAAAPPRGKLEQASSNIAIFHPVWIAGVGPRPNQPVTRCARGRGNPPRLAMAMAMGLLPRLYRSLLRHATRIDRAAHLKTLLYMHPMLRDQGGGAAIRTADAAGLARPSLAQFCTTFLGGDLLYNPLLREEQGAGGMTVRDLVRGCFDTRRVRQPDAAASTPLERGFMGLRVLSTVAFLGDASSSSSSAAAAAVSRAVGAAEAVAAPASAGGAGVRVGAKAGDAAGITPFASHMNSCTQLRAALEAEGVRSDAILQHARGFAALHPQASVGAGLFLHAHPCLVQGSLTRSVICMASHSDKDGSLGVIINSPSQFAIEDDSSIVLASFSQAVQEAFLGKRIWTGGDVDTTDVYCIFYDRRHQGSSSSGGGGGGAEPDTPGTASSSGANSATARVAAGGRLNKDLARPIGGVPGGWRRWRWRGCVWWRVCLLTPA